MAYAIKEKILPEKIKIGFEDTCISYQDYIRLTSYYAKKNLIPLGGLIAELRSVKDSNELEYLTRASVITDEVFTHLLTVLKPGIREIEVAAEISYLIKRRGGEKDGFDPIVASGSRAALPHAVPGNKKLESGEMVILDFGAVYNGYHADLTRTVAIGEPNRRQKEIYTAVLEAQKAALDEARSGITSVRLDTIARTEIIQRGYGEFFGHGLGHGIGLEIHEAPRLAQTNRAYLRIGNVLTIEPGIYIPEFCGVRIEDDIVIEKGGCRVLTSSPKELTIL